MKKLQVSFQMRTDGLTLSDDLKRFRESPAYQEMLDWFRDEENQKLLRAWEAEKKKAQE